MSLPSVLDAAPDRVRLRKNALNVSSFPPRGVPRRPPREVVWSQLAPAPKPRMVVLYQLSTTKLRQPIYLTVEEIEGSDLLVSDPITHLYGVGGTMDEALEEYGAMLLDDYEYLSENVRRLSPALKRQLRYLSLLLA